VTNVDGAEMRPASVHAKRRCRVTAIGWL